MKAKACREVSLLVACVSWPASTSVSRFGVGTRVVNALRREGVETFGDLRSACEGDPLFWLGLGQFGVSGLGEIREALVRGLVEEVVGEPEGVLSARQFQVLEYLAAQPGGRSYQEQIGRGVGSAGGDVARWCEVLLALRLVERDSARPSEEAWRFYRLTDDGWKRVGASTPLPPPA